LFIQQTVVIGNVWAQVCGFFGVRTALTVFTREGISRHSMKNKSLQIDLTHLFLPAIADGPASFSDFQQQFLRAQKGLQDFKTRGLLAYADLPFQTKILDDVLMAVKKYKGCRNVVVFGIGGSALGAQSIDYALRGSPLFYNSPSTTPRLLVLDHIEPSAFLAMRDALDPKDSVFVLISKSGDTSETLAQYLFLIKHMPAVPRDNIFVITDPKKGFLRELATRKKWSTLPVPPEVGGRFSVFSAVGLFPLALVGIDVASLVLGAKNMQSFCNTNSLAENPGALMAVVWHYWLVTQHMTQVVMMPYSDRLRYFSDWFAQLFGESLGKKVVGSNGEQHVGFTPIKAVGVTDQHSQLQLYLEGPRDKLLSFVDVDSYDDAGCLGVSDFADDRIEFLNDKTLLALMRAEKQATAEALRENQRPNQTVSLASLDEYSLGQLYQLFMNVVPYLGALLDINPFDQPAVERIKRLTFGLMGRKGFSEEAQKLSATNQNPLLFFSDEKI